MMKTAEGKKIKIISAVAPRWQELGDQLEFDEFGAKLDVIKTKNNNDPEACCREINVPTLVEGEWSKTLLVAQTH